VSSWAKFNLQKQSLGRDALEARALKPALSAWGLFKRLIKSLPVYMPLVASAVT
jgi:hypothetical protein